MFRYISDGDMTIKTCGMYKVCCESKNRLHVAAAQVMCIFCEGNVRKWCQFFKGDVTDVHDKRNTCLS